MTVRQLKEWLDKLPPDFNDAEIGSWSDSNTKWLSCTKRVIAYRYRDKSPYVGLNVVGIHLPADFEKQVDLVSVLQDNGLVECEE